MDQLVGQTLAVGRHCYGLVYRLLQRAGAGTFLLIGTLVFLSGNVYFLQYNSFTNFASVFGVINVAFYGILGFAILLSGLLMDRSDISSERYPRAIAWIICGVAFLFLLNGPIMAVLGTTLPPEYMYGWLLSVVGTGSTAGAVVGAVEARSIERAHINQRLHTEREAVERHADQLDYLNSLLRHEVLNNVSIIKGYAEYCLNQDEKQPDSLEVIHRQSEAMAEVISDVRALLESLQGTYTLQERNLSDVLTEELDDIQTMTEAEVEIEADIPDDVTVLADELLPRVFRNLFSNAIVHNDSSTPRIEVTVERKDDVIAIRVADNGPGIPESKRETLFERGQRVDHGLGLYLVHELIARYGGSIELEESGSDGTEFCVTLNQPSGSATQDVAYQGPSSIA